MTLLERIKLRDSIEDPKNWDYDEQTRQQMIWLLDRVTELEAESAAWRMDLAEAGETLEYNVEDWMQNRQPLKKDRPRNRKNERQKPC